MTFGGVSLPIIDDEYFAIQVAVPTGVVSGVFNAFVDNTSLTTLTLAVTREVFKSPIRPSPPPALLTRHVRQAIKLQGIKSGKTAITAAWAYSVVQNEIKRAARDL